MGANGISWVPEEPYRGKPFNRGRVSTDYDYLGVQIRKRTLNHMKGSVGTAMFHSRHSDLSFDWALTAQHRSTALHRCH